MRKANQFYAFRAFLIFSTRSKTSSLVMTLPFSSICPQIFSLSEPRKGFLKSFEIVEGLVFDTVKYTNFISCCHVYVRKCVLNQLLNWKYNRSLSVIFASKVINLPSLSTVTATVKPLESAVSPLKRNKGKSKISASSQNEYGHSIISSSSLGDLIPPSCSMVMLNLLWSYSNLYFIEHFNSMPRGRASGQWVRLSFLSTLFQFPV